MYSCARTNERQSTHRTALTGDASVQPAQPRAGSPSRPSLSPLHGAAAPASTRQIPSWPPQRECGMLCACESSVPRRVYPTRRVPVLDMLARGAVVHGYSRARACVFAGALGAVQAMPWPTSSFSFRSSPSFSDVTASSLCRVRTHSLSQPTLTTLTCVTPSACTPRGPPEYSRRQYCTPRCACPAQGLGWVTQAWVYVCARANYPSACICACDTFQQCLLQHHATCLRHLLLATPRNMLATP
jgi:hypothetical protein